MVLEIYPIKNIAGALALLKLVAVGGRARVNPLGEIAHGFEVNHHRREARRLNLSFAAMCLVEVVLECGRGALHDLEAIGRASALWAVLQVGLDDLGDN